MTLLQPGNGYFSCGLIYGADWKPIPMTDAERFGFFSRAALEFVLVSGRQPDVFHIHDWQTAPLARAYWEHYRASLPSSRVVTTIHNLAYGIPLVADAVAHSQRITTVSPSYADEIASTAAVRGHLGRFSGVVNGIDTQLWDPLGDPALPVPYHAATAAAGKAAAVGALRARLGLAARPDACVVGIVTRLTGQKGTHLIKHAIYRCLERGCQVVLLGSAPDAAIQRDFDRTADDLRRRWPADAALVFKFDEPLSHLIYAAADLVLVPSMFEPCGLSQLIGMRYGAIPLVRRTGGLADTVFDVDTDAARAAAAGVEPNGFVFEGADGPAMDWALSRAQAMWDTRRAEFRALQARVMEQDWGWARGAEQYIELYHAAARL